MELIELLQIIKKERALFFGCVVLGLLSLLGVYLLPAKYLSTGSIYVGRKIEPAQGYYAYDGYYNQQSAVSYTNSVVSLVESIDVLKAVVEKINLPVNEITLKKVKDSVAVKKTASQVITITTKSWDEQTAKSMWQAVSDSTMTKAEELNRTTDPALKIQKVTEVPITRRTYKSPLVFALTGVIAGVFVGIITVTVKHYTKGFK